MYRPKNIIFLLVTLFTLLPIILTANSRPLTTSALTDRTISQALGWIPCQENRCGGYYFEPPFSTLKTTSHPDAIELTANQMTFAQRGTSIGQGKVTITRLGQQIIASKAYLYRDPVTGKLNAIDLVDNVTLREPNSLVTAKTGHFDLSSKGETLHDILYRTAIYSNQAPAKKTTRSPDELQQAHQITQLSAWGKAEEFSQVESKVYEFQHASYSTCPPLSHAWQVQASHIHLDKNTGRGVAKNAWVYVKGIPIFYTPYINFPIDGRRQTGFLNPTAGTSSKTGISLRTPFYWNMAPNYDSTITPAFLGTRGLQLTDSFRYLTSTSQGTLTVSALPNDRTFRDLKKSYQAKYQSSTDPSTVADLRRLQNNSDTRSSLFWQNNTRFNENWSANVDYSQVSDDYYLSDLTNNFNEVSQNQLLQQAQLTYQNPYWKLLGRVQGYQTLHPVDQTIIQNQYTRLPQLVLEGDYPNAPGNLDYFIMNDLTHFDINSTPGSSILPPTGNRLHIQPGVSFAFNRPYFYFNPRLQLALTHYELNHLASLHSTDPNRALPIADISSGLYFDRNINVWSSEYRQTLEPQIYYTYVPYKNQDDIPVFDTSLNTLTYDELFMYNRFSGLDRIGDTNQISYGVTSRLIESQSGFEKLRAGVGQILYFHDRKVTLCSTATSTVPCSYLSSAPENQYNKSPVSGVLSYSLNPRWHLTGNSIWDVQANHFNNQTLALHYQPDTRRMFNLSYSFVRSGDLQVNDPLGSSAANLSQTDFSFAWPITRDWSSIGRWTQNWNHHHFQNLLYGLQYDSCCWAVRFVTGRAFANLSPSSTYQYNTQFFIQFALKGLGNYGNADPSQLLSNSVSGYQTNFGQDY